MTPNETELSPPKSPAERMMRAVWNTSCWRSEAGAPMVSTEFVAELGKRGRVLDVRTKEEITGTLGYIPGVTWVSAERIAEVAKKLPKEAFVVLVSRGGERAAKLAQYLELLGMRFVAAMEGGMRDWRMKGFVTRRDEALLSRTVDTLQPYEEHTVTHLNEGKTKHLLTCEEVTNHIGDPGTVRWIKVASLVVNGRLACVDGRDDNGVIGTPGGNTGEFLLSLGALEATTGKRIEEKDVSVLLSAYIDAVGRFYLHSDTHAMNALILQLRANERISHLLPPLPGAPEAWRKFHISPPQEVRPVLRELLLQPEHIGCGHLKRTLLYPDLYGVRPELTKAFILALWELHWSGSLDTSLSVLPGEHAEGAVVNVVLDEAEVSAFSRAPLVSPSSVHGQMFLNTPQVSRFLREQSVSFMLRNSHLSSLHVSNANRYRETIQRLASEQMAQTLGALAKGLPVYEALFRDEEHFSVKSVGVV